MRNSFANRVRQAAKDFRARGRTFSPADIAETLEVQLYSDRKRIHSVMNDLRRAGEIKRIGPGQWTHTGTPARVLPKQKVMWNYFRMRMKCGAAVTVEELQAAAGASTHYVKEWLKFLVRAGFVKKHGDDRFQLLKDPVEMPVNDRKAARLRALREDRKKGVIAILSEIKRMASEAEGILAELSE